MSLGDLLDPPLEATPDENEYLPQGGFPSVDALPARHVRLFAPFILEELKKNVQQPFLSEKEIAKLEKYFAIGDPNEQASRLNRLFFKLTENDKSAQRFAQFYLDNPSSSESMDKFILMQSPHIHPAAFDTYVRYVLFNKQRPNLLDSICNVGHVTSYLNYFSLSHEHDHRQLALRIQAGGPVEKKSLFGLWKDRCTVIILLIAANPKTYRPCDWIFEFLKACNMYPEGRSIAYFMDKNYVELIELYTMRKEAALSSKKAPLKDFWEGPTPTSPRPQSDYPKLPGVTGELCDNISLRKYQEELTAHAKRGISTVICAPTGSGKTVVAADIIMHHLRENVSGVRRAVMFVPTIPLVSQQAERFVRTLMPQFGVTQMSGAEKAKAGTNLASTVLQADVCVMTPQIFVNMLMSPLKTQKLFISDFTLFVIDECHHCTANHPYNVLMELVRKSAHKPQVVGLTASVGDGQSGAAILSAQVAQDHIIQLCARLNVSTIASIRDPANMEELNRHVPSPVDEIVSVPPNRNDKFAHKVAMYTDDVYHAMSRTLQALLPDIPELNKEKIELPNEPDSGNGTSKITLAYTNKVAILYDRIQHKIAKHSPERQFCLKCLDLIKKCVFALRQNSLLPASYAFEYLVDEMKHFKEFCLYSDLDRTNELGEYRDALRQLMDRFDVLTPDIQTFVHLSNKKPILDNLFRIIIDQFTNQRDSRVIVFVEMRVTCEKLMNVINEHKEIVSVLGENPARNIVSVNQSTTQFGQNIGEQQDILNMFRKGHVKILVATSVAEEGIDVADCNLVIKYNNCGSEKSYVQRKGRGRAMNSRSVLLALDSATENIEYRNMRREYLMKMCVRQLQSLGEKELRHKIDKAIHELEESASMDAERDSTIDRGLEKCAYVLKCTQCDMYICRGQDVRRISDSQFVVCDPATWIDTDIATRLIKRFGDQISTQCGDWMCKCGKKRGEVLKYGESFLPSIQADSFRIFRERNNIHELASDRKLKWKDIQKHYFSVPTIEISELRTMSTSLYDYRDAELYKKAVTNEVKGLQNACLAAQQSLNKPVIRLEEE
uniref:RNA helicase n=1 Tax=Panagrellus redivivus TaxID=6233 RepID=A0A7E4VI24_PANRE